MPYIDLHAHVPGFALIKTTKDNRDKHILEGGSDEDTKQAMLPRTVQKQIGCPPDQEFKQILNTKSLKKFPVTVNGIANTNSILGTVNHNRLKGTVISHSQTKRLGLRVETGTS
jgi:hypothetical protein